MSIIFGRDYCSSNMILRVNLSCTGKIWEGLNIHHIWDIKYSHQSSFIMEGYSSKSFSCMFFFFLVMWNVQPLKTLQLLTLFLIISHLINPSYRQYCHSKYLCSSSWFLQSNFFFCLLQGFHSETKYRQ